MILATYLLLLVLGVSTQVNAAIAWGTVDQKTQYKYEVSQFPLYPSCSNANRDHRASEMRSYCRRPCG